MPSGSGSSVGSNSGRFTHDHNWSADETQIILANTEYNLGSPPVAGKTLCITEVSVRTTTPGDVVVTVRVAGETVAKITVNVLAGSTAVWSSIDGRRFEATEQPVVLSDNVAGGTLYVSASGLEA